MEVVSETSRDRDYIVKLQEYFTIASLREYLVVEQEIVSVTHFSIDENGKFSMNCYKDIAEDILLPSLQIKIPVSQIYKRVQLIPQTFENL